MTMLTMTDTRYQSKLETFLSKSDQHLNSTIETTSRTITNRQKQKQSHMSHHHHHHDDYHNNGNQRNHQCYHYNFIVSLHIVVYIIFIVNIFILSVSQAARLPNAQQLQSANQRERFSSFNVNNNQFNNRFNNNELPPNFTEIDFPVNFTETEDIDFAGKNFTGEAPKPILTVAVRQNGIIVDSAIEVQPGTPLEMIIYLDEKSSKVYGLTASYLKVTDNTPRNRSEVIVMNGCSIDNYLFGQFELNEEDKSLRAKFRAFKFPDSNHLLFVGTVNVCIKQCPKIDCGYGQVGYGRRRKRSANNNLFSLDMTTMIRMGNSHDFHLHEQLMAKHHHHN